jgi:hypothetical protein
LLLRFHRCGVPTQPSAIAVAAPAAPAIAVAAASAPAIAATATNAAIAVATSCAAELPACDRALHHFQQHWLLHVLFDEQPLRHVPLQE